MTKFAYLDEGKILHITERVETAERKAGKNYIETNVPAAHGFPIDEDGEAIIMYSDIEEKHGKNERITPELAELYRSLRG